MGRDWCQVKKLYSIFYFVKMLKIPKLWTAIKCAKIIALTKLRSILKTSFQWLLNDVKQTIPQVLFYCVLKA